MSKRRELEQEISSELDVQSAILGCLIEQLVQEAPERLEALAGLIENAGVRHDEPARARLRAFADGLRTYAVR